jgi:chromosome segregation ATPase
LTVHHQKEPVPINARSPKRRHSMNTSEVQQRFSQVENSVHQAAQQCQSASAVPMDLKDSIQQLDQRTNEARQMIQSQDENQIRQCVDELEQLGDRAKDACEQSNSVDGNLRNAVMQAHRELSELKHQLH